MSDSRQYLERGFDRLLAAMEGQGFGLRPTRGPLVPRSGLLPISDAVEVCPANAERVYLLIQNPSDANLYAGFGLAATEGGDSLWLGPGSTFVMENAFVCPDAISLWSDTDDAPYLVLEASYAD